MAGNLTQEEIIARFKNTFGNYYDYSKVVFRKVDEKVIIICPKHGEFMMRPRAHYTDRRGCTKCDTTGKSGFSTESNWFSKAKFIYLIEVNEDSEQFLNYGITIEEIETRIQKGMMPYPHKILYKKYIEDRNIVENIEQIIKEEYLMYAYSPLKEFRGKTKCLQIGIKADLMNFLNRMLL